MMDKKLFWGIKIKELLLFFGTYSFFSFLYSLTLWLNRGGWKDPEDVLFNSRNIFDSSRLQYLVFLPTIALIWYLIFRVLKNRPLYQRLLIHLPLLPLFVILSQKAYYFFSESLGFYHLEGTGRVWDLYIPTLVYVIFFGIFHAYHYYTVAQQKLKQEGVLKEMALKSELSAIKAQLNPHFLYNVFNTINASVPAENERTRNMIAQLSDLFRYQLQATKKELVTLGEELEFVQKYLALEKERFHDRLHVDIKVSQNLMDEKIPPMLLQPLVENSVKHGLSSLIEGGSISLHIFKENDRLKFEISDTGIGIKDKEKAFNKGVGLTNTRLRLEKIYETPLELLDNYPKGLTVKFAI